MPGTEALYASVRFCCAAAKVDLVPVIFATKISA